MPKEPARTSVMLARNGTSKGALPSASTQVFIRIEPNVCYYIW